MTPTQTQIVKAYDDLHLSIEDICEQWPELDPLMIKLTLQSFSPVFRKALKEERELKFTDDAHEIALSTITNLMHTTEDENIKFRCAKFIRQDATGRLDAVRDLGKILVNTELFNAQMKQARAALERTRQVKVIDAKEIIEEPAAPIKQLEEVIK